MTGVVEAAKTQPRWPFAIQQFAAQLVDRLPRLLRTPRSQPQRVYVRTPDGRTDAVWIGGRHIGQLCDAIARHRLVERGWTAPQVLEHVDRYRASMRADVEPAEQRDPLAWLFWLIGKTIAVDELAPRARAEAERERQRAESAARRAADAELRERIAAQQPEIDAILAQMHRQFPRTPKVRRPKS